MRSQGVLQSCSGAVPRRIPPSRGQAAHRGREAAAAPPGVPGRAAKGARAAAACRWGSGSTNRLLLPKTASARRPPPLCLLPGKAARLGCGSRPRVPSFFTARALLRCSCSPWPGTRSFHPQDARVVPPPAGRAGPTATRRGQPRCSWPSPPEQPPAALLWRRDPRQLSRLPPRGLL